MPDVTIKDVYELIAGLRTEILAVTTHLEGSIHELDVYKIGELEKRMGAYELAQARRDAAIEKNQAVLSTKFVILSAIAVGLYNAALYELFKNIIK